MSLKEFTKEVFTRYGFTEDDIKVYLCYLRTPRATISEVHLSLGEENALEFDKVTEITNMLVEKGFLIKVEGIVDRYIPLEPFFELFTAESENFRKEIAEIKDKVLADQSSRFEKLEAIQDKSVGEVESAVSTQLKSFFDDSDTKNKNKKDRIDKARKRFTDTTKTLEKDLHAIIEEDFERLTTDINKNDQDADAVWDSNSSKFTKDNDVLNKELAEITKGQVDSSKTIESNVHSILDALNADLKSTSDTFVSDNESGITTLKDNLTKLVEELLTDFATRVDDLEKELKKDLDNHVERHKNVASELKPKMEQILEKYLERMNKVISDLKDKISKLLGTHTDHIKNTTDTLRTDVNGKVDEKYRSLVDQINKYRDLALKILANLLDSANRFSDFSEDLAHQGLFFTGGKKKKYKARWAQVEQDLAMLSRPYKENFEKEVGDFVNTTQETINKMKNDVADIMGKENKGLAEETSQLDTKAQETINAELETLATDMASEIDSTLQTSVKDCSDTNIKLKDSATKSLKQHSKQYDTAINRHRDDGLRHYTDCDTDVKRKNASWVKDVNGKFEDGKRDVTTEIDNQIRGINDHLEKTRAKNVGHSKTFDTDVKNVESEQRGLFDELLKKVRTDSDESKANTSEKINNEIKLWNEETTDTEKNLSDMLVDHKTKYKENATTLQTSLSTSTKDTVQSVKDAIADFTLHFMNAIDDATEKSETNQSKLKDISTAAAKIPEIAKVTSWHTVGRTALVAAIKDAVYRTKSSIIIVTPIVIPEILQVVSEFAYEKKAARFMLTSHWDMGAYGNIIQKMKALQNIQFRQLSTPGEYFAVTRDAEEVIICPYTNNEAEMISIISNQTQYAKLYSSFIGPIFQANSRPIQ